MAKITSLIEFTGSVGNLTGYKGRDGRNVIRHRISNPRNAKTISQMARRVAWANLVNFWRAITPYMTPSFESKGQGLTDYNSFMAVNIDSNQVFLNKKESRQGAVVAAPYQVTQGSLHSINVTTVSGGKMTSDIALGDFVIDADSTVANFTHAIFENNTAFEQGDQLTALCLKQIFDTAFNIPRVVVVAGKVILDSSDSTHLWDCVPDELFSVTGGYLSSKSTVNGGIVWIHSRKDASGKTLVSSQNITINNNALSDYTSQAARDAAIKSYGGARINYLTPTVLPAINGGNNP